MGKTGGRENSLEAISLCQMVMKRRCRSISRCLRDSDWLEMRNQGKNQSPGFLHGEPGGVVLL